MCWTHILSSRRLISKKRQAIDPYCYVTKNCMWKMPEESQNKGMRRMKRELTSVREVERHHTLFRSNFPGQENHNLEPRFQANFTHSTYLSISLSYLLSPLCKSVCFLFESIWPFKHEFAVLDSTMALEKLIFSDLLFLQSLFRPLKLLATLFHWGHSSPQLLILWIFKY